jgi:DNA mismatch repair protein MutS2
MKFMIKYASRQSLILIDELGSGTEPLMGAAIAEALLHRFNKKNCFAIITTHYHNLKIYAGEHEGIINGAMLYDCRQMQPLFQLSIGATGSSFAIEIARKIGLPEDIIAEASAKIGQDHIDLDKYRQNILRDKQQWEQKQQQIRSREIQLQETEERYKAMLETLEAEKRQWMARACAEAEKLMAGANAQIENTIRTIKESQAETEQTRIARKQFDDFREKLKTEPVQTHRRAERITRKGVSSEPENTRLSIGDAVRIKDQNTVGIVINKKNNTCIVAIGSIKATVKVEQLEKIPKHDLETQDKIHPLKAPPTYQQEALKLLFTPQIDIRGMHVDEALQAVTGYIDEAVQLSVERVRILHGTGSGVLRQIIRQYLQAANGIKRFNDEHPEAGGTGITVVDLE